MTNHHKNIIFKNFILLILGTRCHVFKTKSGHYKMSIQLFKIKPYYMDAKCESLGFDWSGIGRVLRVPNPTGTHSFTFRRSKIQVKPVKIHQSAIDHVVFENYGFRDVFFQKNENCKVFCSSEKQTYLFLY